MPRRRAPHRPQRLMAPAGCPPAAAASRASQSAAAAARPPELKGSQLSGSCGAAHLELEVRAAGGPGPGKGPSAPTAGTGTARPGARAPDHPGEARSPSHGRRGSLPGGAAAPTARRASPGGSEGPRLGFAGETRGLSRGWDAPLSASRAVTAGDVSASPRAEGTGGGAGFWASRELCPLSCCKKPNQKTNLQASKRSVTLSAGRGSRTE